MAKENQKRKPVFFFQKQFWNVTAPPWQAPPYGGLVETHRTPYVLPITESVYDPEFWKVRARTWEPACRVQPPKAKDPAPTLIGQWQPKVWSWTPVPPSPPPAPEPEPEPEPPKQAEEPAPPPPPEPVKFYYRRSFDAMNAEFSPYSPHAITLANKTYHTAAHLYWYIVYSAHPDVLAAMDQLDNVADHDENLAHLLRIAIHFRDRLQHEDEVDDKRLGVMQAVQALKLNQHQEILDALLATGELPLQYTQLPAPGASEKVNILEGLASQLFPSTAGPSRFGKFGRPLPADWVALLHPDDVFWGIDPDSQGNNCNYLGKILMILREGFRTSKAEMLELCEATSKMLATAYSLSEADIHVENEETPDQSTPLLEQTNDENLLFNPEPWLQPIDATVQEEPPAPTWLPPPDRMQAPRPRMRQAHSEPNLGLEQGPRTNQAYLWDNPRLHHTFVDPRRVSRRAYRAPQACTRPHLPTVPIVLCCQTCQYRKCCCGLVTCVCVGVCPAVCCCCCTCPLS